jgi:hypothetical protein
MNPRIWSYRSLALVMLMWRFIAGFATALAWMASAAAQAVVVGTGKPRH